MIQTDKLQQQACANPNANKAAVLGMGSTFPNMYTQEEVCNALEKHYKFDEDTLPFMRRVFAATKFESVACASTPEELGKRMTRTEYVEYIKRNLKEMGARSARQALEQWGGNKSEITHIVWGTMTQSIHAPTMDIELCIELGLEASVQRLNIEGMGCLTGYRCLGLARAISESNPDARVLVVVSDIRSALMNQMPEYPNRASLVCAALFRDSAGAIILGQHKGLSASEAPLYTIMNHRSFLIPDSFHCVKLTETDEADILLDISKEVPIKVSANVDQFIHTIAEGFDVDLSKAAYALHTGGPKVVKGVAEAVGLPNHGEKACMASWKVMNKYGNLSGSSNLVVLHHQFMMEDEIKAAGGPDGKTVVCLSFGPGLAMEGLLLKRCEPGESYRMPALPQDQIPQAAATA